MCIFHKTLLALALTTVLWAPEAEAQRHPGFGAAPMPMRGGTEQFERSQLELPPQFGRSQFPQAQRPRNDDNAPPMSDSVRRAQQLSGGRVIGTERVQSDGRAINRVKVIDGDGRVRYIDDNRQMPDHYGRPAQTPQHLP